MALTRLIYFSETNFPLAGAQGKKMFRNILEASAKRNVEKGLTGALVFDWDHFLQILEGDRCKVSETFTMIAQDPRHKRLVLVDVSAIDERLFSRWNMVLRDDSVETAQIITRFSPSGRFAPDQCTAQGLIHMAQALMEMKARRESVAGRPVAADPVAAPPVQPQAAASIHAPVSGIGLQMFG